MSSPQYQAKRPASILAGPYGHPYHPILVSLPVGAWTASLAFDLASLAVANPGFLTQGSLWLIAIGLAGALAAATAGFLDLFMIPVETPAYRTAMFHMSLNLTVTFAYLAGFGWRFTTRQQAGPVPAGQIALSAGSIAMLAFSCYLGGKLAYRYGVRVADERTQAQGFTAPPAAAPASRSRVPGS